MTQDFTAKYEDEYRWWDTYLHNSIRPWYRGEVPDINYYHLIPAPPTRGPDTPQAAAMEFRRCVAPLYFQRSWEIDPTRDYGNILDIGCGPLIPTADLPGTVYAVDPNLDAYRAMGYPVDEYGAVLVPHAAEDLGMLPCDLCDTVLSNNALNHVNDFEATVAEMERIARPGSFWRFETEYREPTLAEPHLLDDARVLAAFHRFQPRKLRELHWDGIIASCLWGIGE
jgi:SAM-dependent methyltransferase